jgi:hypothetical protein
MSEPVKWKVVGERAHYWGFKIMKPGQIFTAAEESIPADLRPHIVPTNDLPTHPIPKLEIADLNIEAVEEAPKERKGYRVKARANEETVDIIDVKGKKVNENPLTKEQAAKVVQNLKT